MRVVLAALLLTAPLAAQDTTMVRDTVRAPIATPLVPRGPVTEGLRTTWDREQIFRTGALNLADLVAQVPGATLFTSSIVTAPTAMSWNGAPGRVRVFLDGVEVDVLDGRLGGSVDLTTIPLWPMESVVLERGAAELRIHLSSWRVLYTPTSTRTDVTTGTDNVNIYRGFFGKRMDKGGVFQIAGQQYSEQSATRRGDGDALSGFVRMGTVRGDLTLDAVGHRMGRNRNPTRRGVAAGSPFPLDEAAIPHFEGHDVVAYLRAAWRNPDSAGVWWQALAATIQHVEDDSAARSATSPDLDSLVSQGQFTAAAGLTRGNGRLSAVARYRTQGGEGRFSPALRLESWGPVVAMNFLYESNPVGAKSYSEVAVRVRPLGWVWLGATSSGWQPEDASPASAYRVSRAEAGLEMGRYALRAGAVLADGGTVFGMPVFDTSYVAQAIGKRTGLQAGISGPIIGPLSFEWYGTRWDTAGVYLPQTESHAALRVSTSLVKYLPRNKFRLTAEISHDWRGTVTFPGNDRADGKGVYGGLLDIRLGNAHLFYITRNAFGQVYETVPGYVMPRLMQVYGIRWEFWN